MLSFGKLAYLAQVYDQGVPSSERTLDCEFLPIVVGRMDLTLVQGFHDELDFVSVHEALLADFRLVLGGARGRQSLESQIDTITKTKATGLAERKGMLHVSNIDHLGGLSDPNSTLSLGL